MVGTFSGGSWVLTFLARRRAHGRCFGLGEDEDGNVYLADGSAGKVYKYILDQIFLDGFDP